MRGPRRLRTLILLAAVGGAHLLVLALMSLETPSLWMRTASPWLQAVTVTLAPPVQTQRLRPPPKPQKEREREPRAAAAMASPAPPAPIAAIPESELPNLAKPVFRVWPRPLPGGTNWGASSWFGCDDPDAYHLDAKARERCKQRWEKTPTLKAELAPLIAAEKTAAYERRIRCRDKYELAAVPSGTASSRRDPPIGSPMLNPPASMRGLGYVPSLAECPPADR
jgi:hypothetical protein